eukprot:11600842-Ditylum_brightwellii.AAC.1
MKDAEGETGKGQGGVTRTVIGALLHHKGKACGVAEEEQDGGELVDIGLDEFFKGLGGESGGGK